MNESSNPEETQQPAARQEDVPSPKKEEEAPSDSAFKKAIRQNRRILSLLGLQVLTILVLTIAVTGYADLHRISAGFNAIFIEDMESFSRQVAAFDFVGTGPDQPQPNFYSIVIEVFFWSFFGVLARDLYYLTNIAVRRKEFDLLESLSKMVGDTAIGVAIAIAVVGFLRSTEVSVGNVSLTLKSADIELIAAIAFILGFYHEDTRRLLGSFQKRVSGAAAETGRNGA